MNEEKSQPALILDEIMNSKFKHCKNPTNFFAYYYIDNTDELDEKDIDYDLRRLLQEAIQKTIDYKNKEFEDKIINWRNIASWKNPDAEFINNICNSLILELKQKVNNG